MKYPKFLILHSIHGKINHYKLNMLMIFTPTILKSYGTYFPRVWELMSPSFLCPHTQDHYLRIMKRFCSLKPHFDPVIANSYIVIHFFKCHRYD